MQQLLHYDKTTGIFNWLENRPNKTTEAGYLDRSTGYIKITVDNIKYSAHRLAFIYVEGEAPHEVDHINHIRDDNRWLNLRPVTHSENTRNTTMYSCNKSGFNGVDFRKDTSKWRARIRVNRRLISLGSFSSKLKAIAARRSANVLYGFHENHGLLQVDSKDST